MNINRIKNKLKRILSNDIFFYNLSKLLLKKHNFQKIEKQKINTGYSIIETVSCIEYPVIEIKCILNSNNGYIYVMVQETPHFKLINNYLKYKKVNEDLKASYLNYLNEFHKEIDSKNKLDRFIKLADKFAEDISSVELIIKKEVDLLFNRKPKLIDGLHRLSILASLGIRNGTCFILHNQKNL